MDMRYAGETLVFFFFAYSFLGWVMETIVATVKGKSFANRGFVSGPFCFIYGFTAATCAITMGELVKQPIVLFLGCTIVATTIEWATARLLEHMGRRRWWDYSKKRFNYDGYICLQYSILWGALGTIAMLYGNDLLEKLFLLIPSLIGKILIWCLIGLGSIDGIVSLLSLLHLEARAERLFSWSARLQKMTYQLGTWLSRHVERRMVKAHPAAQAVQESAEEGAEEHSSFFELFWLFVIASFLGDIVETIFCRIRAGVWMSRSSLVWGPFSVVWGMALVLATVLLKRSRNRNDRYIFFVGTVMGGAYEYICSVLSELVFGAVFWDYSSIPFNLGGRINLLYCFFWGIAAVIWIKGVYPLMANLIRKIQRKAGVVVTWCLVVFMAANIVVSASALIRYSERSEGVAASNGWEELLDEYFDDERINTIYPNLNQR